MRRNDHSSTSGIKFDAEFEFSVPGFSQDWKVVDVSAERWVVRSAHLTPPAHSRYMLRQHGSATTARISARSQLSSAPLGRSKTSREINSVGRREIRCKLA